jgi:hypothetical protein
MECKACSSTNVERLSHYWQSLPAESPLRVKYAPPSEPEVKAWMALLAVGAGIAFVVSGAVLLGLLVAVAGLVSGAAMHAGVQRYQASLADWSVARICLACTGRF